MKTGTINIREEKPADHDAIRLVNDKAFGQPQEGNVIEKIRNIGCRILSLVAEVDHKIVGHIFFSPVKIDERPEIAHGMGLAPMAVLPGYQEQGIGMQLIREGIRMLKEQGVPFIVVLGHAAYYPKSGFEPASKHGLKCQWPGVPDEAFMALILDEEKMKNVRGVARYREEWNEAM